MVDGHALLSRAMSASILLVTSFDWTRAERLAGAFAQAGAQVDALFPAGHPIAQSQYLRQGFGYRALAPLAAMREAITESGPDLIIPCDDRASAQMVALYREAGGWERALIARSLGAPDLYDGLTARTSFIAEAAQAGAPVAETFEVATRAALDKILGATGFPAVIKSDHSCGGEGVVVVQDRSDAQQAFAKLAPRPSRLRQLIRALKRRDPHFLHSALKPRTPGVSVQRFITGHPATSNIACWQGKVLAANHFDVVLTQRPCGPASVILPRACAAMDDAARAIARRFQLSGLHGLDYIRDRDDRVHLLEINPRATPTAHLAFGPGHDLCAALLGALGFSPVSRPAVPPGPIALFPQEAIRDADSHWLADGFKNKAFHDVPWDDANAALACVPGLPGWLITALKQSVNAEKPASKAVSQTLPDPALTIRQAAGR
jgi:hypothetical protein